jgi:hypothetical protein
VQVRIGFYSWLDDKNTEYNEGAGSDSEVKPAFSDVDGEVSDKHKPGGESSGKPKPPLILRILCCGSTNYHWWVDTFVGVLLTIIFCIACGIILGKPPGQAVLNKANLVDSNHSGSTVSAPSQY